MKKSYRKPPKKQRAAAMAAWLRKHGITPRDPETPEQFAERLKRDSERAEGRHDG